MREKNVRKLSESDPLLSSKILSTTSLSSVISQLQI